MGVIKLLRKDPNIALKGFINRNQRLIFQVQRLKEWNMYS